VDNFFVSGYKSFLEGPSRLVQAACTQEMTRTGAERSKCNGLLKKLTNWYFVAELAMIKDALRSLQELSLFLQRENASAVDAFC
jgi:hypothetical protein